MYGVLFPHLAPGGLAIKIPVALYACALGSMAASATLRDAARVGARSRRAAVFGGCVFLLSDSTLAIAKFQAFGHLPAVPTTEIVMFTYYAALAGITLSVVWHEGGPSADAAGPSYAALNA